jgi:phospholipase C
MTISRREALRGIGGLAGAAAASRLMPGCAEEPQPTMVFLMMENRSFDHFFGARSLLEGKAVDGIPPGATNPDLDGNPVGLSIPAVDPEALCVLNPPHGWNGAREQWNGGAMDGFVRAFQNDHPGSSGDLPMQHFTREHVPVSWALADAYTTCDRWFSSLMGPTLPNRLYWMAAQANGARSNEDVLSGAYVGVTSIFDHLDQAGIAWAYYYGDLGVLQFLPQFVGDDRIQLFDYFLKDAAAGRLPPVVFIDPSFTYNDFHPPHYPLAGEQLIAATYTALATSPQWPRCQLILTFDEHGGFYDHVAPGKAADARAAEGFDQLGMRVPALAIGPQARAGHVSSVLYDHTSALRHIENRFALDPLTLRDAAANDLSACFDATLPIAAPIHLPAVEVDESKLERCVGKAFEAHVVIRWGEARGIDVARRQRVARDGVYAIGEYLDRHGVGRIRRGR